MKSLFCVSALLMLVAISTGAVLAEGPFVLGVAPHTSARVILESYQPLRLYLEKSLGTPVEVRTAPDFTEFVKRAIAQEYDLAVTTGHQARLLQTDAEYIPVLTYKAGFKAVALVAAAGQIRGPSDLKGKSVLGLSPSSLVTLWGQHWLMQNGLGSVPMKYVSASDSVATLVIGGEAAAGFTSLANYQLLKPEIRSQLRILAESPVMAGRVYVLNHRDRDRKKRVDEALWGFAGTPEGTKYFETTKLEGYRKLKQGELESMDSYAAETRKVLLGK
jgi:phosphonate transport system substrate-binding protein